MAVGARVKLDKQMLQTIVCGGLAVAAVALVYFGMRRRVVINDEAAGAVFVEPG